MENKNEASETSQELSSSLGRINYLITLSEIVGDTDFPNGIRTTATSALNDCILDKDQMKWVHIGDKDRNYIKNNLLNAFATDSMESSLVPVCYANIAVCEMENGSTDAVIGLCRMIYNDEQQGQAKVGSLNALGHICLETNRYHEEIFNCYLIIIKKPETSSITEQKAALDAFKKSLGLFSFKFQDKKICNEIMEALIMLVRNSENLVTLAAMNCVNSIYEKFYNFLDFEITNSLAIFSVEAMNSADTDVSLSVFSFWINILDRLTQNEDFKKLNCLTSSHLKKICPIIINKLVKHGFRCCEDDIISSNLGKTAVHLLSQLSSSCDGYILPHVSDFIFRNLKSDSWQHSNAALIILGSIIKGFSKDTIKAVIHLWMESLTAMLEDKNPFIQYSITLIFKVICQKVPEIIEPEYYTPVLNGLINGFDKSPNVNMNVCTALSCLTEFYYKNNVGISPSPPSLWISPLDVRAFIELFRIIENSEKDCTILRDCAFSTMMTMIKVVTPEFDSILKDILKKLLNRLHDDLTHQHQSSTLSISEISDKNNLQLSLIASIQIMVKKLKKLDLTENGNDIMKISFIILNTIRTGIGILKKNIIVLITIVAEKLGTFFYKYMDELCPLLCKLINYKKNFHTRFVTIDLISCLSPVLGTSFIQHVPNLIEALYQSAHLNIDKITLKHIMTAYANLSLHIGPEIVKYVNMFLRTTYVITKPPFVSDSFDVYESCLFLYIAILDNFSNQSDQSTDFYNKIKAYATNMIDLIKMISLNRNIPFLLVKGSVHIINHLLDIYESDFIERIDEICVDFKKMRFDCRPTEDDGDINNLLLGIETKLQKFHHEAHHSSNSKDQN